MPFRRVNRSILAAISIVAILSLVGAFGVYHLLASQLAKQKEHELFIAGTAVSQIIENYISSAGSMIERIADSEALEKYHVAYNALALRAYLEPLLQHFDGIAVTDARGQEVSVGQVIPMALSDDPEPTKKDADAPNTLNVSTLVRGTEISQLLFTYRYVNYFDEPIATIRASAAAIKFLPGILDFTTAARIRVSIVDDAGRVIIDQHPDRTSQSMTQPPRVSTAQTSARTAGFHNDVGFLDCDCVANVLPIAHRGLTVFTIIPREEYDSHLAQLRWTLLASALILLLTLVAIVGLLRESNYQLGENKLVESKIRFKNEFMAKMSHELRTPLNAIIGYSELLYEELDERRPHELRTDIDKIISSAKHLLHLINQILDIQKIEAGKMKLDLERFSIDALLQDTIDTMLPLAKRMRQDIIFNAPRTPQPIFSDITKVRQIVLNFLSNALKFSGENTKIEVVLESAREDERLWYWVRITDQGPGIEEKDLEKLFQEFTQLETTSKQHHLGTGLGLAINKRLCDLLGGEIFIDSEKNKGTRVSVKLPAEFVEKSLLDT